MKEGNRLLPYLFIKLLGLVEAALVVRFVTKYFSFKEDMTGIIRKQFIVILILFGVLEICISFGKESLLPTAIWFFMLLLYSTRYLNGNFMRHSIWCLVVLTMSPIINILLMQIMMSILNTSVEEFARVDNIWYIMGAALSKLAYFAVLYSILRVYKNMQLFFSKWYGLIFCIVLIYSLLMEGTLYYALLSSRWSRIEALGMLVISVGIIIINLFLVTVIYKVSKRKYQEEQMELLRMQNEIQEQQIKEIQQSEDRIRKLQHDYKNHIISIYEMVKSEKYDRIPEYLNSISEYYLACGNDFIDVNNPIINAAINARFRLCAEEGIETSCFVNGNFDHVNGFKLGTILFNLLDNAIEASRKEDIQHIFLELKMKGEYVSFLIKNRIGASVLHKNPGLITTKIQTENHGIGLGHVKDLVKQEEGMIEVYEKDQYFCVHGMIPLSNIKEQFRL